MRPITRRLALFPLWPLILGVITGVYLGDFLGLNGWILGSLAIFVIALIARKLPVTLIAAGIVLGYGSHGYTISQQDAWLRAAKSATHQQGAVQIEGTIIDTGAHEKGPYLVRINKASSHTNQFQLPCGSALVLNIQSRGTEPPPTLQYGDIIAAEGALQAIPPLRNPFGFDRARWRHRQGADAMLVSYHPAKILGVSSARKPVRLMSRWRLYLRDKMTAGLEAESEQAQLIRAVVLGERPPRTARMIDDFRNSGTLHVFAVSGLHVGMVGLLIALVLGISRAPRWLIIVLTIIGMILYAGITGLRPPAVRAVIMATVFLSGFLIQRRPTLINSLAASAILVLLWDGHQLFTPGFQLSYGVLLAIALLTRFWSNRLKKIAYLDPFMPRLLLTDWQERRLSWREKLHVSLAVSCSAWVGSSPLIWLYFGIITPISIVASLPLMTMVFGVLSLAMLSITVGAISAAAGEKINQVNALVASATHGTAAFFANIPGGHIHPRPPRSENGRIIVFDIPNGGGANLIDLGTHGGGGVLLDSGKSYNFRYEVQPTLSHLCIAPDSLIISHADTNHCGGMNPSLRLYQPKQAIIPLEDQRSPSFRRFIREAKVSNCRLITPHRGQIFPLDQQDPDVFLEILHAPAELEGEGRADDTGIVIRLHWHGWKIIFTGDAGFITESRLLDSGADLRADLIIMGRNRADISGHLAFIEAVSPRAIIASHSDFPENERIPARWITQLAARKIPLFDQKTTGAVTLTLQNGKLVLTPMLPTANPLTLSR